MPEKFDLDVEVSQPNETSNQLGFLQLIKNVYKFSKFTFRLLCRNIGRVEAIPVMISVD